MDNFPWLFLIIGWPSFMIFSFLMYRFYVVPQREKWAKKLEEEFNNRPPEPEAPPDTRTAIFSIGSVTKTTEGRPLLVGTVERGSFKKDESVRLVNEREEIEIPATITAVRDIRGEVESLQEGQSGVLEVAGVSGDQVTDRMVVEK